MIVRFIPRKFLASIGIKDDMNNATNTLISISIIVLFFLFVPFTLINEVPHFCLFQSLFGIPCPGCGVIRGLYNFVNFKGFCGLRENFVAYLFGLWILFQFIISFFKILGFSHLKRGDRIMKNIDSIIIFIFIINYFINLIIYYVTGNMP